MANHTEIPVLIIGYRRVDSLKIILNLCAQNRIKKIYVSVDGPKNNSGEELSDYLTIKNIVNHFSRSYSGEVFTLFRENNVGCSASILLSCNWIFKNEKSAIILEDDCVPADDFFKFAKLSLNYMESRENIWLACGTQLANLKMPDHPWSLSKYPLIWGWATTKEKWNDIFLSLLSPLPIKFRLKNYVEKVYWNSGARRAINGWVDAWDVILAQQMIHQNKKSIVSGVNLISNLGYDTYATNVDSSNFINLKTSKFQAPELDPKVNNDLDQWLKKYLYKISLRHLFTTQFTRFKDMISLNGPRNRPLKQRILVESSIKKQS